VLVIVTISGAEKAGAFARIVSFFGRKGYGLRGHQIVEAGAGSKNLVLKLEVERANKEELSVDVKHIDPGYAVVSVAFEGTDATSTDEAPEPAHPESETVREMSRRFPDITELVRAYGDSLDPKERDRQLFEAGKKVGGVHYSKEWSFGTPLKMPLALRRALVPALENFGKVYATDTNVAMPESPFCPGEPGTCRCEFLAGFMQGFLDAGPLTKETQVQRVTCKAEGGTSCAYTVAYDA
jgi:predicted hydrocarbon binding protein